MEIIAYRGKLDTLEKFTERMQERGEITTQDVLQNASIALFEMDKIDYRSADLHANLKGIQSGEITVIDRKSLPKCTIKAKPTDTFANHAEISGISAADFFKALKSSGVHFDYVET